MHISARARNLKGEGAFAYLELGLKAKAKGLDVISFGIGQPDFPTPPHIREEAKKALDKGITGYGPSGGLPELREAVAEWINSQYGTDVKPSEVIITAGAKAGIFLSLMVTLEPGDEVIISDPSYPAYESVVKFMGAKPVPVPLREENNWAFNVEDIEKATTSRTRIIILNYPHNPTGATLTKQQLDEIMELARRKDIMVLADEIYDHFLYDGTHTTTLSYPGWRDYVIHVNGFSKTFSMTGWRLGYVVANEKLLERMATAANNIYSCPPTFNQVAAIHALKAGLVWFKPYYEDYKARRDLIVKELSSIEGVSVVKPQGTFYAFPNVDGLLKRINYPNAEKMVVDLLFDTGVLLLPGTAFPFKAGKRHLRTAFTIPQDKIREGMRRFREWVEEKAKA